MALTQDNQNFSMRRGESRLIFIDLDVSDGSPFNPANADIVWWVAKSPFSIDDVDPEKSEILIKKGLGTGITVVTNGINIELEPADTHDLQPGYYYHELKVFLQYGGISSAVNGTIRLRPSFDIPEPA